MSVSNKQQGFSLLEVLVAFVVMGLVVGTLLQLFGSSMYSTALADEYSFAVQVAESRLADVGNEIKVEEGEKTGEEEGSAYRWKVIMQALPEDEASKKVNLPMAVYRVEVIVTWNTDGKNREYHLSSLRFGEKKK